MNESPANSRPHWIVLLGGSAVLAGVGLLLVWIYGIDGLENLVREAWARLQTMPPLVFFSVMAFICMLPVPVSAFYIASGPLYGFVPAMLWITPAIAVNQIVAYALSNGILRPALEDLLARRGMRIPTPQTKSEQTMLTVMIRVVPGVPYFLQNAILGLANVDRVRYLMISLPVQLAYAAGFVLLGESAFEGRAGVAVLAVGLLVFIGLLARWVGKRLQRANAGEAGVAIADLETQATGSHPERDS